MQQKIKVFLNGAPVCETASQELGLQAYVMTLQKMLESESDGVVELQCFTPNGNTYATIERKGGALDENGQRVN